MTTATSPQPFWRSKSFLAFGVALGLFLIAGLIWLIWNLFQPYAFHGMVLQSPMPATDFTLSGSNGQPVTLSDYRGKLVLLYFGYTTCPDVCPTTLAELRKARELLGKRGDQVQVLMVTIDPERDTLEILGDYITHFDSSFIALTGTSDQIAAVATYYGIFYQKNESDSALGYLMDHTATVMAIDRQGYLRVVFPFGATAQDIAADLDYLLKR
ncbi:MAG: SCO family protein [Chloroflexi bacterium]|nr:SCO family protein [Chloroflexota bacterium]